MNQDTFNFNGKIYSNYNNLLLNIIDDLKQIANKTNDNLINKRIGDIIIKMNFVINENKKNYQSIMQQFSLMQQQLSQINQNMKNINTINNQEFKYGDGNYIGQSVHGIPEGKGTWYGTKAPFIGDSYEGEWRNGKMEGKRIYYWNDGNRYEGDWRNGLKEGKGIHYHRNGDRTMGDYYNDKPIGRHAVLTKNGEVKSNFY